MAGSVNKVILIGNLGKDVTLQIVYGCVLKPADDCYSEAVHYVANQMCSLGYIRSKTVFIQITESRRPFEGVFRSSVQQLSSSKCINRPYLCQISLKDN